MDIYSQIANLGTQFQPVTSAIQGYSSGLQLQEMMRRRDAMQQQQAQQSRLQELLSRASAGDTGAYQQALAIDPQQATMFAEGISRQQASQSAASRARSEQVAKAMLTVESAPDVMKPAAYQQLRQRLAQTYPDIASKMPEQYDQIWVRGTIDQAMSMEQLSNRGPEYQVTEIGVGGRKQKAYIPKRPGAAPIPIGDPYRQTPETQINIGGEKAEAEAYGKSLVGRFDAINERASAAEDAITQLSVAKNIDVTTGALEPLKARASALAESLGFNPSNIGLESATNAQSFQGIMNNLVLTKMQAQKGPQTENDAKRIEQTLAQLGNTPAAKDFLLDTAIALEERKIEQRDFYLDYRQEKGTLDGADRAWNAYKKKTPLVAKNPKSGMPVFFNQFKRAVMSANPQASEEEVVKLWRDKYGSN